MVRRTRIWIVTVFLIFQTVFEMTINNVIVRNVSFFKIVLYLVIYVLGDLLVLIDWST